MRSKSVLFYVPLIVLALLVVPTTAGMATIFSDAFGWGAELGAIKGGGNTFTKVLNTPGFFTSLWLSLWIGMVAPLIALIVVILFTAAFANTGVFRFISILMKPVLAVPHAAAAFSLLFLIAPSGFLVRLVSPELSGFTRPPDWLLVNDPAGFSMLAGLVIKEIPFLFFVTMAALPQTDIRRVEIASLLGYGRIWGWLLAVFPAIYRQIRLPVFATIVFASSTIDVALVLGPVTPPPLSVRVLRWMNDPDIAMRASAAAGALIQVATTLSALVLWWWGEKLVGCLARMAALRGWRGQKDKALRFVGASSMFLGFAVILSGLVLLALWSFAGAWRFPDVLPYFWTTASWSAQQANLFATGWRALVIGIASASLSLVLVLACLENEYRGDIHLTRLAWWIIYLPLLIPQIAFVGGLSALFLYLGIDGTLWAVILVHVVFVYPYVYLTLADPWNAFDVRYLGVARTLGKSVNRVFWSVRLPILLRPVLAAFALGFAVSISQYLPTLLIGAGRQPTITTEAVALASGGNRRLIGIYALIQTILPFVVFALASIVPRLAWRQRRALQVGQLR